MLAEAVYAKMTNDTELVSMISSYEGMPAIFENDAQPGAKFIYITFHMDDGPGTGLFLKRKFTLYIDVWDYQEGGDTTEAKRVSTRIEELFDRKRLEHQDYGIIQCYMQTRGLIREGDGERDSKKETAVIHIAHQFEVTAWRKKFINSLF
jgi:hypothetical protein